MAVLMIAAGVLHCSFLRSLIAIVYFVVGLNPTSMRFLACEAPLVCALALRLPLRLLGSTLCMVHAVLQSTSSSSSV